MLHIQTFLQSLIANGTPVIIIAAGLPGASGVMQVVTSDEVPEVPAPLDAAEAETAVASSEEPPAKPAVTGSLTVPVPADLTPLERLKNHTRRNGSQTLKLKEWATLLGVSNRELGRAVQENAVSHEKQDYGRGHGAWLVTTSALQKYLEIIHAVERGDMPPPAWFSKVRRRR